MSSPQKKTVQLLNRTHKQAYRMLVVDDDDRVCRLFLRVADKLSMEATAVTNPRDVIEADSSLRPDLIMLDLSMPGLDGVEVLRGLASARCQASICLVSGARLDVLDSARALGRELGLRMGGSLHKPLDVSGIISFLSGQHVGGGGADPSAEDLEQALEKGHVRPFYQPKVCLSSGETVGVEVLARWEDPEMGFISPEVFVSLAEDSGLIWALTSHIMQRAFEEIATLELGPKQLDIALNLSPLILTDLGYPDLVERWATAHGIAPQRVILEITENEAMRDRSRYLDIMVRFRLKGFRLSADDFGTGFSSLVHLYTLPFEEIKIDKSFVADLNNKTGAEVIVKAIVDLGHGLNHSVIAEGVEDSSTAQTLAQLGCDLAQGYHFCRPQGIEGLRVHLGCSTAALGNKCQFAGGTIRKAKCSGEDHGPSL
ncbi:MAG: EAL domain-containing response regulator [Planctomycetota bacterium]|nr:EAL domain-containing response regulator [Planctomycetota bacterium]